MSMHMYLDLGVETTIFDTILDVVVSAVGVITSTEFSMRFPLTVNLVGLGFYFCWRQSTTMRPYIIYLRCSLRIFLQSTNKMVSNPLTFLPKPCYNLTSLFTNDFCHTFFCLFYFIRCLYSIASPVAGSFMGFTPSWTGQSLHSKPYWP